MTSCMHSDELNTAISITTIAAIVFYWKLRVSEIILIYHRHKPIDSITMLGSYRRRNVFPVRYGQTYRVELSFK
jgi:hypothetical protein